MQNRKQLTQNKHQNYPIEKSFEAFENILVKIQIKLIDYVLSY